MIIVEEDHIVSEEESFVESEEEEDIHGAVDIEERPDAEEAIIANIDDEDEPEQSVAQSRPRRSNAGAGVERMQMDFAGKGYGARREFNFSTNGKINKISQDVSQHTYMQIATDTIFT